MEQKKKQDHKFYGGFRYAIEGILTGIQSGAEYEDALYHDSAGGAGGIFL